eukprot:1159948-Pelagomonas_calceolata.AAC.11
MYLHATSRSIIELARLRGYTVLEEPISIQEAMESDEVFTTGTAVVLCAVHPRMALQVSCAVHPLNTPQATPHAFCTNDALQLTAQHRLCEGLPPRDKAWTTVAETVM